MKTPPPEADHLSTADLLRQFHEEMDENVNRNVNHAFNLGCLMSMLPGLVLVLLVFLISGRNITATLVSALLATLIMLAVANVLSYITRKNTAETYYRQYIAPQLHAALISRGASLGEIYAQACQELPESSFFRQLLSQELSESEVSPKEGGKP